MWHVQMFNILHYINIAVLVVALIPFALQLMFMLLAWLPKKRYPKTEKKNKVCIIIPAHNEADVIYDTVKDLIDNQNYPKDLYDVYVVAHNCKDNTAELAKKAGAIVYVFDDPAPDRQIASYAMKHGYQQILNTGIDYKFSIKVDADNHLSENFIDLMNDAFNAGVQIARPYEAGLNLTQNNFTKTCGLMYTYDSRFSSRVRERLHIDAHVNGPGSMVDFNIIRNIGGYDTTSITEDTEFVFKRMLEGYKCHFVEDAVVYEDLPSTLQDTVSRNNRISAGNVRLLFKYGPSMLWNAIKQFRFSFIEQIMTFMINISCVILGIWLPLYYGYDLLYVGCSGYLTNAQASAAGLILPGLYHQLIIFAIIILVIFVMFLFVAITQGIILICSDYKKLGVDKRKDLLDGAFIFPAFSMLYAFTGFVGALKKPKWTKVNRNKKHDDNNKNIKEDLK